MNKYCKPWDWLETFCLKLKLLVHSETEKRSSVAPIKPTPVCFLQLSGLARATVESVSLYALLFLKIVKPLQNSFFSNSRHSVLIPSY